MSVAEPLAGDEDRATDMEAKRVVLEGRTVPIAHEETDQRFVAPAHLGRLLVERDARRVDHRQVGGEGRVQGQIAAVENGDERRRRLDHRLGHSASSSAPIAETGILQPYSDSPGAVRAYGCDVRIRGRHLGLVLSLLAARLLPCAHGPGHVPRLLCEPLRHRRAEHHWLPAARGRPVPPLGRGGARRLPLRAQAGAAAPGGAARLARPPRRARRPARPRAARRHRAG